MSSTDATGRKRLVVPVVITLVLILMTALLVTRPGEGVDDKSQAPAVAVTPDGSEQPSGTAEAQDASATLARRQPNDPMALGKQDAPVVMVAYSEFQCPFCGKFARDTEPTLVKQYVDKGVLRIEWRDFPYLGEESWTAARAGRAAGAQGKFWQFHDALYAEQLPPNSGRLTEEYVTEVAREVGLDTRQFTQDLGSATLLDGIQRDFQEGQSIGVNGTPAFLINGQPVMGAQPTAEFVKVIEQAAKSAS